MLADIDSLGTHFQNESNGEVSNHFATGRLNNPCTLRDLSGNGLGNDCEESTPGQAFVGEASITDQVVTPNTDGSINVCDMNMHQLRKRLICHFNIAFSKKEVIWPIKNV